MPSHIIVGGAPRLVDFDVRTWHDTALHFMGRFRKETRAVMCHWTAAENPPERVYANMKAAGLSVHFIVSADAVVYQCADADVRAAHALAHGSNGWSVGIEFVGRGNNMAVPTRRVLRPRVIDEIHGHMLSYDDLTAAQTAVGVRLVSALCRAYRLPIACPLDASGDVASTELAAARIGDFRGVLGHLHVEERKPDPGMRFLRSVHRAGRLFV